MPVVQVTMLQGRTADQKRKIAQRITDAMVEEAGARREAIVVTFVEVSKESYASGGVLMIDKNSDAANRGYLSRRALPLPQRLEQIPLDPVRHLGQFLLGKLQEVRGGAVGFERGIVLILLVDEEPPRFGFVLVNQVHGAARFFAGFFGEFCEDRRPLRFRVPLSPSTSPPALPSLAPLI